eukprot:scaffold159467_cov27-Tisochrysis_lutea.AAC.2
MSNAIIDQHVRRGVLALSVQPGGLAERLSMYARPSGNATLPFFCRLACGADDLPLATSACRRERRRRRWR